MWAGKGMDWLWPLYFSQWEAPIRARPSPVMAGRVSLSTDYLSEKSTVEARGGLKMVSDLREN